MAGLDAIILTGRSPEPVWLWIRDGVAEIRDARDLWGQDPPAVQAAIKAEVGEKNARVLQIGRAGENLVPYAMLMNELRHYNGRTGMGAVMGSKNVRAIAVKGSRRYLELAHDAAALREIGSRLAKEVTEHPQGWDLRTKGTPGLTDGLNAGGILPTRNFRQGAFEGVDAIGFAAYEAIRSNTRTCYACAVRCKPETAFADRYTVTDTYDGPEYEAVAGFGSNCAIFDLQLVAKANELCNEVGLDVISTAGTVAFVMECVEHGLLGPADLAGVDLRFGNGEALLEAIPLIAERRGIGELLALGSRRIAEQVGGESIAFAMQVKGLEMAMHEPRGKVGVALGYATNEAGADHLVGFHDGVFANPESVSFKGARKLGHHRAGRRPRPRRDEGPELVHRGALEQRREGDRALLLRSGAALVHPGRRRRGRRAGGDRLGRRGGRAPGVGRAGRQPGPGLQRPGGIHAGRRPPARHVSTSRSRAARSPGPRSTGRPSRPAVGRLFELKGWDPATGVPTPERLRALGLEWAADLVGAR